MLSHARMLNEQDVIFREKKFHDIDDENSGNPNINDFPKIIKEIPDARNEDERVDQRDAENIEENQRAKNHQQVE